MSSAYATLVASFTKLYRYQHLASDRRVGPGGDDAEQRQRRARRGDGRARGADARDADRTAARGRARRPRRPRPRSRRGRVRARDASGSGKRRTCCPRRWSRRRASPARAASTRGARSARPTTGRGFLANWRPVVACARQEATLLAEATGLSRYDALVDRFEPGMTAADDRARCSASSSAGCRALIAGGAREAARRDRSIAPQRPVPDRGAARARPRDHGPARLRLRRRPARRVDASVLRRRAPRTCASPRATARTTSCRR